MTQAYIWNPPSELYHDLTTYSSNDGAILVQRLDPSLFQWLTNQGIDYALHLQLGYCHTSPSGDDVPHYWETILILDSNDFIFCVLTHGEE